MGGSSDRSPEEVVEGKHFCALLHESKLIENSGCPSNFHSPISGGSPASLVCRDMHHKERLANWGETGQNDPYDD